MNKSCVDKVIDEFERNHGKDGTIFWPNIDPTYLIRVGAKPLSLNIYEDGTESFTHTLEYRGHKIIIVSTFRYAGSRTAHQDIQ